MESAELFPPEKVGEYLKEQGIALVAEHSESWAERAATNFRYWARCHMAGSFSIQDFRAACTIGEPHHPNAWGAFWNGLAKQKIIVPTGEHAKSRLPGCHARPVALWKLRQ